ncbi:hypothetical protein B566_EDAN008344 [Ephemera danica]|nr:hypothetical protein B566_EDAN008344 [Ephemera danica]
MGLLSEAQEQVRKSNKRQLPSTHMQSVNKTPAIGNELEKSLLSFHSLDSGFAVDKPSYRRVFETVRSASRSNSSTHSSNGASPANQMFGSPPVHSTTFLTSASGHSPRMSPASLHSTQTNISPFRPPLVSQMALSTPPLQSLMPQGSPSLSQEMALANTQVGVPANEDTIDWALESGSPSRQLVDLDIDSYDCRTPESIMSTGSLSGASGSSWRLPHKLQIIKPLEGSATLHHWSQLARPNLGSALTEQTPCVLAKGQSSNSEVDNTQYSLEDFEEDEAQVVNPGKQFEPSGHTFTLTNSTVLHPEERTMVTASCQEPQLAVSAPGGSSRPASPPLPGTPGQQARRDSTVTFSTNLGLAKGLMERGTGLAGSSPNASACATPCNSPERPSSPQQAASSSSYFSRILAQGSEKLGWLLPAFEPRKRDNRVAEAMLQESLANIKLMKRINQVGIDNILRRQPESGTYMLGSPLSQLLGQRCRLGQPPRPPSMSDGHTSAQIQKTPEAAAKTVRGREVRRDLGSVQARPGKDPLSGDDALSSGAVINFVLLGRKGGLF